MLDEMFPTEQQEINPIKKTRKKRKTRQRKKVSRVEKMKKVMPQVAPTPIAMSTPAFVEPSPTPVSIPTPEIGEDISADEMVAEDIFNNIALEELSDQSKNKKNELGASNNDEDKVYNEKGTMGQLENILGEVSSQSKNEAEYLSPPSYENIGRGLVYSCKEGHWACIGRSDYLRCRENFKWSVEQQTDTECVTSNVYHSIEDCQTMQVYNINKKQSTDFCKKK